MSESKIPPGAEVSADVVLPAPAFDRVVELLENPPAPSSGLRSLFSALFGVDVSAMNDGHAREWREQPIATGAIK